MSKICDDLRAAILQVAMQGRLTSSDSEYWSESTIADICELSTGNSIPESVKNTKYTKVSEGRNYIGTKDLAFDHSFNYENGVKIPFDERNFRIANRGDVLLCIEGGSAGRKIGILEEDVNYGNKLCRFSSKAKLDNRFLYFYIQSPMFQEQFSDGMTGIIGGVSIKKIKVITIKYPDIPEQKRIVEKVDELMARVADLEKSTDALTSLKKTFPGDIKASLLQAAMQGKLTKQLPEDGNAEDLLEEIKAEKEKLIAEGKIKKRKPLTPITDGETPFSIPENWRWERFGNLGSYRKGPFGSALTKSIFVKDSVDAVKVYEQKNAIKKDATLGNYYISRQYYEEKMKNFQVLPGDIIVSCAGTIGETYIMPDKIRKGIINQALMRMRMFNGVHIPYFLIYFDYIIKTSAISNSKGSAIKNIPPFEVLNMYPVAIPPLAEQKRIVERLDAIMQNIDAVENLIAREYV